MNRKEREKFDLHTGKIKLTPQEIQKREEEVKQRKALRKKQTFIILSSLVGALVLIIAIPSYFNWRSTQKKEQASWPPDVKKPTTQEIKDIQQELIVMETTMGTIKIALDPEAAPLTVNNFRKLVREQFYDGIIFHRVINDFMIQAGGYTSTEAKEPGYSFKDEINPEVLGLDAETIKANAASGYQYDSKLPSLKMEYGVIAMANAGANTNGSQFFIVTDKAGATHLNGKHTVFGKVVEGMEVAEKIQKVATGENDKPKQDVIITKAYIQQKASTEK